MSTDKQPDNELDEMFLQYHAEQNQGLNELAGHGTPDEQFKKKLLAWRDSHTEKKVREELKKPNDILRSVAAIADREEFADIFRKSTTNWSGFKKRLHAELEREHKLMYPEAQLRELGEELWTPIP